MSKMLHHPPLQISNSLLMLFLLVKCPFNQRPTIFFDKPDHPFCEDPAESAGLTVYVHLLMNEFPSQPWDFFSDATGQIKSISSRVPQSVPQTAPD
jgi:hypothetical protein